MFHCHLEFCFLSILPNDSLTELYKHHVDPIRFPLFYYINDSLTIIIYKNTNRATINVGCSFWCDDITNTLGEIGRLE